MNKKLVKLSGISVVVVLMAVLFALPAQAEEEVFLSLTDVSCNATTDTLVGTIVADDADYELGIVVLMIENLNGTTDNTSYTPLYEGYFEDTFQYSFPEDVDPGDYILVNVKLTPNGSNEILAWDGANVQCTGVDVIDAQFKAPTRDVDPEPIDNIKAAPGSPDGGGGSVGQFPWQVSLR